MPCVYLPGPAPAVTVANSYCYLVAAQRKLILLPVHSPHMADFPVATGCGLLCHALTRPEFDGAFLTLYSLYHESETKGCKPLNWFAVSSSLASRLNSSIVYC